jgi:hydroxymethylbilane synthase
LIFSESKRCVKDEVIYEPLKKMNIVIKIAARSSPLSKAQVLEVKSLLQPKSCFEFEEIYLQSIGDLDLKTPLTTLEKTDFFTQNIDQLILDQKADIAIHSAKDLPDVLPQGLEVIALTEGVDPRDSLVSFKYNLNTLPLGAKVGVCSKRRIEGLKSLRQDLVPCFIRGPIDQRLKSLEMGEYDAIILAEAGLLRLKSQAPRQILSIEVSPMQGKLAIVALSNRHDLKEIFKKIDVRVCG